uniref:Uncharacterized protein n=1 Tax=Bracon brevicornis TaxID=1563983 RepID=A0A6V7HQ77_9HYME
MANTIIVYQVFWHQQPEMTTTMTNGTGNALSLLNTTI